MSDIIALWIAVVGKQGWRRSKLNQGSPRTRHDENIALLAENTSGVNEAAKETPEQARSTIPETAVLKARERRSGHLDVQRL